MIYLQFIQTEAVALTAVGVRTRKMKKRHTKNTMKHETHLIIMPIMHRMTMAPLSRLLLLGLLVAATHVAAFQRSSIPSSRTTNGNVASLISRASSFPSQQRETDDVASYFTDSRTLSSSRRPIVAGNWKLNPETADEAVNLFNLLPANFVNHRTNASSENTDATEPPEVLVFPPFPYLKDALDLLEGSGIKVGAQNVGLFTSGAYTGEVSARMVHSMGVEYVIFGHSERRCLFEETDQDINAKLHLSLKQPGLQVISCVGETDEEYESELLASVCDCQIKKGLKDVTAADLERIVIAYESIWAIGTGKVATPQQAQIAHVTVRKSLSDMYGHEAAAQVRIQYGGSVKAENVDELMAMPDVDGALVGGASLDADSFTRIVDGASSSNSISQSSSRPKELTARLCVSTKNVLGESPVWSVKDQALYWISAPEEEVWNLGLCSAPCKRHGRLFGISGGTGLFGIDNSNNENQRATENEIDDTQTDPTRMLLLQQEGLLDRINRSKLDRINRSLRFRWFAKEISFFWHGNHICRCVLSQERQRRQAINAEGVVQCLVVKISLDALLLHTFIQRTAVLDKIHDGQRIPTRGRQTRDSQLVHGAKSRTAGNAFGK